MRVRSVPLQPCRRHGKKRKDTEIDLLPSKNDTQSRHSPVIDGRVSRASSVASDTSHGLDGVDSQLQSSQVITLSTISLTIMLRQGNFSLFVEYECVSNLPISHIHFQHE